MKGSKYANTCCKLLQNALTQNTMVGTKKTNNGAQFYLFYTKWISSVCKNLEQYHALALGLFYLHSLRITDKHILQTIAGVHNISLL